MNHNRTKRTFLLASFLMTSLGVGSAFAQQPTLIATSSISATYEDYAVQTAAPLENGIPGNRLGGMGSGLAYMGGDNFLALPDRGPNAKPYSVCLDDTASYINRFQTLHMSLSPSDPGSALPFTLTPMVTGTTLLHSDYPLVYGAGCGGVGSGAPALNSKDHTYYFTGRSDNFDPSHLSTYPRDARFDTESIRVSNDRKHVYISDEYGPYVYEFDLKTGVRTRAYTLPDRFAMYRPGGDQRVREVLAWFIAAFAKAAEHDGLVTFHQRLAAFQNRKVRTATTLGIEDFFGWAPPEQYDEAGKLIPPR